ncbi:MAG: hypothetical protein EZS28_019983 [Streblomastix strix]|uniref:Uncharacterized protein n=1 Tax=Streblomastix strix TaxID=222440 RepID=A0A5J4VPR7_9EUKA|nr:MAG: hypothetical protein EZS28_019983 [Streblomastix strix]
MVINNDFPVKIEANDRRYVVCRCKAVHRDDVEYFTSLSNEILKAEQLTKKTHALALINTVICPHQKYPVILRIPDI